MTDVPDFIGLSSTTDPYPVLAEMRERGPVVWDPTNEAWSVTHYAEARQMLGDAETFSSRAVAEAIVGPIDDGVAGDESASASVSEVIPIIGLDGADHRRLRTIVSRAFTPRHVSRLRPFVEAVADDALDGLIEAGGGDLQTRFSDRIPPAAIAELLGVGSGEHDAFVRWSRAMVLGVFGEPTESETDEIDAALGEMGPWFDAVLDERAEQRRAGERRDDVFSLLLTAEEEADRLTPEELRVFVFTLLVAGSFTTAHLIGNGVVRLIERPELLARMAADPALVPLFVEEVLRHDSPSQLIQRTATCDVEVAGQRIRAGARVNAVVAAANRDGLVYPDGEEFDLDRDAQPHLGFGHGPHFCLGAGLARLEAVIAFERLADRISGIAPAGEVERSKIPTFRGPTMLPAEIEARSA